MTRAAASTRWRCGASVAGSMRFRLLLGLLLASLAGVPRASAEPKAATAHAVVVLDAFRALAPAVAAAKRASTVLHLPLAEPTLRQPPASPVHTGSVVALLRPASTSFLVTSFLGPVEDARQIAGNARKTHRRARVLEVAIDEAKLDESYQAWSQTNVLILGSRRLYAEALALARRASAQTGIPFSTRGMIYDEKRGLIWPDTFADSIYAGSYWGRRYNACDDKLESCISIERSEFYGGFRKGYYIVVGGLLGEEEVKPALARVRAEIPDAYAKKTSIYLGCIH